MKELDLKELMDVELETMKQIHKICIEQGFKYSLSGGTLLGAIRHKGFIPWDDDIDIFMPRADYDKFIDYCKNNSTPFNLLCTQTNENYKYLFAKATAKNTILFEEFCDRKGVDMGVYIDIFPIDDLGESYDEAIKLFKKTRFRRELLVAKNWKSFTRSKTHSLKYEPIRFAFYLLSRFISAKAIIKSLTKDIYAKREMTSQFSGTIFTTYREKEIMPKQVFEEYILVPFEDAEFMATKEWDTYLTKIYGNYMQLPPEEKRVTHHTFKAYYKD